MAQHRSCRYYSECDYRIGVRYCPDNCVQWRPKDEERVIHCAECAKQGDEDQCPPAEYGRVYRE